MLKKGCLLLIILSSWTVNAQLSDTIMLTNNSYHREILEDAYKHPLFWHNYALKDFTQTKISFQYKDLNFKRVQTAEEITSYNFATEGIFKLSENLRVFGKFIFRKELEKALGYNFSLERTENQAVLTPNYFFAPKKGDWENQVFALVGGLSYSFAKNWLMGATLNYKNHKAYRTIDPRPDLQLADYKGKLHVGYTYKKHKIFANAGLERATTTAGIIYVDDSQNSPANAQTFTRFSSGYGRLLFNNSYNRYLQKKVPKFFGLGYQLQQENNNFGLSYDYSKSIRNTYSKDANNKVYFDEALITYKYRKLTHNLKAFYDYDGKKLDYQLKLIYKKEKGDNYSVVDQGQNYQQNIESLSFSTAWLRLENTRMLWQTKLGAEYTKADYTDLLGFTKKKISFLKINADFTKDIWVNKKGTINASIFTEFYLPVEESLYLEKVTSDTSFAEAVIIPDQAYDSTSKLFSGLGIDYTLRLSESKNLRFFADYKSLVPIGEEYKKYVPGLSISTSSYWETGLIFFY